MLRLVYIIRTIQPVLWCYSMTAVRPREEWFRLARVASHPCRCYQKNMNHISIQPPEGSTLSVTPAPPLPGPARPPHRVLCSSSCWQCWSFSVYFKSIFCSPDIGGAVCRYVITYINIFLVIQSVPIIFPISLQFPGCFYFSYKI